jgi:hypothetical protein
VALDVKCRLNALGYPKLRSGTEMVSKFGPPDGGPNR